MSTVGTFIVLEGIDGSGKSTQILKVAEALREAGLDVVTCRDPGTTGVAYDIREILLSKEHKTEPGTDLLLYTAARLELYKKVIEPALNDRKIVICDRFLDSTLAYQGFGRDRKEMMDLMLNLHEALIGAYSDLTVMIDIPVEVAQERIQTRDVLDRFEKMPTEFFERVREGYLTIADARPESTVVIDGTQAMDDITAMIIEAVVRVIDPA